MVVQGPEVDVVATTDESTLIAGEAKFTNTPLGYDGLAGLEDDVPYIDWTPPGGDEPTYEFALFSRSGFKRSVEEAADEREDLRLFDLSDIVAVLESGTDQ
ncbi:hypothetical protein AArcSt11_15070 [Natranaeroarchaeum aerophilus]|uniref:DUF234 domain-containing protein n=1 Tax=Natranaeroarchaeum aerophilus TaxID=2917711 RepID=A0AAE3K688_9EURY|nr:hypothetical protein [Natranaeroarchaeum aerophilus]MCL9814977.1 hypothetical protein [Natranaeroarchaeum aerophilus]